MNHLIEGGAPLRGSAARLLHDGAPRGDAAARSDGDAGRAVDALYTVAHWLVGAARYRDAASVFRLMAISAPADERAWLGLGACHEALGQSAHALVTYGTGRALSPSGARIEIARARLLEALGRDDEAEGAWSAARTKAEGDDALLELFDGAPGDAWSASAEVAR